MVYDEDFSRGSILQGLKTVASYGVPSPESAPQYDVGSAEFIEYFKLELLHSLVFQGGSVVRFIEGPFGSGKSHILELIKGLAINNHMAIASAQLDHNLNLEDWRLITKYILENLEARLGGSIVRSLPGILSALKMSGSVNIQALKIANLPHPGFKNAMVTYLENDNLKEYPRELLDSFLQGEKVKVADLVKCNIKGVKSPLSQRNAEQVLKTVLGGLFHLGLNGTILLFDETEQVFRSNRGNPSRKVITTANLMRRLVDGSTTGLLMGTGVVFAVLPGFIEACGRAYQALGQRLETPRNVGEKHSWRWPVLHINSISSLNSPEEFLSAASIKFEEIVKKYGGQTNGLREKLISEGQHILEANAGSGYRRNLMKLLADVALERIE